MLLNSSTVPSNQVQYDKVLISQDDKSCHPFRIVFLKESLPIRIINGVNGRNEKEVYKELKQYSFSCEISKEEFEYNHFLASKLSTLGVDVYDEAEFINKLPKPINVKKENKLLIQNKQINSQEAIRQVVNKSDFNKITTKEQFGEFLSNRKAVLYIQIDWSGVERIGRVKIIDALSNMEFQSLPKYIIDHSNQEFEFFNNFLRSKEIGIGRLASYGSGEIILFKNGKIVDYIERGFLINRQTLIDIFRRWKTDNKR